VEVCPRDTETDATVIGRWELMEKGGGGTLRGFRCVGNDGIDECAVIHIDGGRWALEDMDMQGGTGFPFVVWITAEGEAGVTRCTIAGTTDDRGAHGTGISCCGYGAAVVRDCVVQRLRFALTIFNEAQMYVENCLIRHNAIGLSFVHQGVAAVRNSVFLDNEEGAFQVGQLQPGCNRKETGGTLHLVGNVIFIPPVTDAPLFFSQMLLPLHSVDRSNRVVRAPWPTSMELPSPDAEKYYGVDGTEIDIDEFSFKIINEETEEPGECDAPMPEGWRVQHVNNGKDRAGEPVWNAWYFNDEENLAQMTHPTVVMREKVHEERVLKRVRAAIEREEKQGLGAQDDDSENQETYNAENDIADSDEVHEEV